MFQASLLKNFSKSFNEIKINKLEQLPIPNISKEEQNPFILLVDTIINAKEKITKYNKHFDSLNAVDKIEIKEAIEKLEAEVEVSGDEVGIVEQTNE